MARRRPGATLFPYPTLFRSLAHGLDVGASIFRVHDVAAASDYMRVRAALSGACPPRSEEHTSELQSHSDLVCRLLLEKKNLDAAGLLARALILARCEHEDVA